MSSINPCRLCPRLFGKGVYIYSAVKGVLADAVSTEKKKPDNKDQSWDLAVTIGAGALILKVFVTLFPIHNRSICVLCIAFDVLMGVYTHKPVNASVMSELGG